MTRTISQAELRNSSAQVMDELEAGQDFIITRNGRAVGELRPIRQGRDLTAEQVVRAFARFGPGDSAKQMRAEADELFGEDRIGND